MKKIFAALLVTLFWAGQLHASPMMGWITVSADDVFTDFTINWVNTVTGVSGGGNYLSYLKDHKKWNIPVSHDFTFDPNTEYTLTWNLRNTGRPINPMGFIGQVDTGYKDIHGNQMVYGSNLKLNDPEHPWTFFSPNNAATSLVEGKVSTLQSETRWPWQDTFNVFSLGRWVGYGDAKVGDTMTVTLKFDTTGATPVPVPAAAWMLGVGLVALVGIRRKAFTV